MQGRSDVLPFDVDFAALALRDDVVFTEVWVGCVVESFLCFAFSAAEFSTQLQAPILGDMLGGLIFFAPKARTFARLMVRFSIDTESQERCGNPLWL